MPLTPDEQNLQDAYLKGQELPQTMGQPNNPNRNPQSISSKAKSKGLKVLFFRFH